MTSVTFHVRGMDCAEETVAIRSARSPIAGVTDVSFNLLRATMTVTSAGERFPVEEVVWLVEQAGLSAEQVPDMPERPAPETKKGNLRAALVALSAPISLMAFSLHAAQAGWRAALSGHETGQTPLAARALYFVAIIAGGWLVAPKAWLAARRLRPDMYLLMTVAVAGGPEGRSVAPPVADPPFPTCSPHYPSQYLRVPPRESRLCRPHAVGTGFPMGRDRGGHRHFVARRVERAPLTAGCVSSKD